MISLTYVVGHRIVPFTVCTIYVVLYNLTRIVQHADCLVQGAATFTYFIQLAYIAGLS